jgi:N-acetyl-alpha-D-muramate 1-phosphate uridylyltransferase
LTSPPQKAMVLAAGLGTRLRPLTGSLPKPLIEVAGKTLLDHALDRLMMAGVAEVVVNLHYKAAMMAAALAERREPRIALSQEEKLLDTGGAVARALPLLGDAFYVVNSDVFWLDGKDPALERLAHAFDPRTMDAILLLQRTVAAVGYEGSGDYFLDTLGKPLRRRERQVAPFVFAGIQILHRRLFDGVADPVFPLVRLFDRAEKRGRLWGLVHDGEWFHVGTLEGLDATRERLSSHRVER